ncbi:major histocompatibility complex class I-related gene protein-like [Mugil cephalus]|uniref:major histocompatibility complex class I-related gene protein-like n=1 Tax=Mugil cephalus TaxID=48193 RepID=UPI001FB5F88E|nr:major histocompatibility complex class I-related gene protein-like [Mugil cephalus]
MQMWMKTLLLLLLLCHVSSPVKHSLKYYTTTSSGVPNLPEFMIVAEVDDIQVGYCDGSNKIAEPRQDWVTKLLDDNLQLRKWHTEQCFQILPPRSKHIMNTLIQSFNHSEGVHILQLLDGCEWEETTGEVTGFGRFGYDGEDLIELDLKTLTWTALRPEADIIKQKWDEDTVRMKDYVDFLTHLYPQWLKLSLKYGNSSLLRTDVPSVSLLQKTPSSPVSCHATGFYPDRARMFWRKDGEKIHEGVEHGEILPNHDGSFQMNVDLDISSVSPEDWRRYDCVFHLSGVEDDIITKLDETQIRTNWENPITTTIIIIIISALVVAVVVVAAAAGFMVHKKKQDQKAPPDSEESLSSLRD